MSFNVGTGFEYRLLLEQPALVTPQVDGLVSVIVYPEWFRQISVEWSVPASLGRCLFDVYFAQTEDGPFVKLNATPINGTYLIDVSTREYSKNNKGYYVVEAILMDYGNATIRSAATSWHSGQNRWVQLRSIEIQRREYWFLTHFAGIRSYLFRRKNYGQRCLTCWNDSLSKVMDDHCPDCLGTSFEGGYFTPAPLYVQYDATANSLFKTYFGNYEPNQVGGWTISFPDIRPDDVIVRTGDWNIYRVAKITPTELQGNTVRQLMVLTQLARNDVESMLVKRNLPEFPVQYTV